VVKSSAALSFGLSLSFASGQKKGKEKIQDCSASCVPVVWKERKLAFHLCKKKCQQARKTRFILILVLIPDILTKFLPPPPPQKKKKKRGVLVWLIPLEVEQSW